MSERVDFEKLAEMVAERTVSKTFMSLGLNINDPISVQGTFAFVRNLQYAARQARNVAITTVGSMVAAGIVWAVWASIKAPAAATAIVDHVAR